MHVTRIWIRRDCFYKSDVYSFGIPVMETFTRKKRTDDMFGEEMNLKRWVKESLPSYYLVDVVDSKLLNTREREGLAAKDCKLFILQLALECSAEVAEERTDMEEVVARLKKIKTIQNSKAELPIQENLPPLPEWRRISYHDLAQAADGFSQSNLLGVGSFGSVYKGTLSTGMTIALKVFHVNQDRASKSFDIECEVLRNIRHRNLVKIINSCSNVEFKALVLEFMPNGSLEKWLYSQNHFLNVLQRLNIVIDIALAVEYLHHDHSLFRGSLRYKAKQYPARYRYGSAFG
ncbi:hypothetical protein GOBAR_DD17815 [Gossypium barbadense]|nr:hypothetical protein GOBAR_DD17815 [Gossypium barbadense]